MELFEIKVTLGLDTKKNRSVKNTRNYTLEEIDVAIKQERLNKAIKMGQNFEKDMKVVNEICKEI